MFFAYYDQIPPDCVFSQFGWQHILMLFICFAGIAALLLVLRRLKPAQVRTALRLLALLVPLLEFSHTYWLYQCGQHSIVKLLPLHLCAQQSFFLPLAVYTNHTTLKEYVFSTSILGGIFGMVFPEGVAGCYPALHYQTLQTMALHSLLILIPLALIVADGFRPKLANFPRVLGVFFIAVIPAAAVDFLFGENYMFLNTAPAATPLEFIYLHFGRAAYLLFTFVILCLAVIALYRLFPYNRRQTQRRQSGLPAKAAPGSEK